MPPHSARHPVPTPTPPTGSGVIDLAIPSDVDAIERVVALVQRECRHFAFDRQQVNLNVPVALTEALSNAILRGNGEDPERQVRVRARVDERELVVEVEDEGEGFDMESVEVDPTAPDRILREDGRGVFLMRKLMDRVERFDAARGNVVRLTLRRA